MGTMDGRTVLVTGAAGAIGKPMCVELAQRGATVVMAGRGEKLKAAVEEVRTASGSKNVEALQLDVSDLKSIRAAAEDYKKRFPKLHVLINNAAVFSKERKTTPDGFELVFGTNYLGHFLLTNLLLDTVKASAPARVVNMTMGSTTPIKFDDLMLEKGYSGMTSLTMSKGAITCATVELAKRLEGTGVVANAVNPELTKSTLPREAPFPLRMVFALFGAAPEQSREYALRVACNPEFEKVSGKFFRKDVEKPIPALYTEPATRERLWSESSRLVGLA